MGPRIRAPLQGSARGWEGAGAPRSGGEGAVDRGERGEVALVEADGAVEGGPEDAFEELWAQAGEGSHDPSERTEREREERGGAEPRLASTRRAS